MGLIALLLGIALIVVLAYAVHQHITRPKLNLAGMESLIVAGENDGKDVAEAAYWTNKAISQVKIKNTVQEELDREIVEKIEIATDKRDKADETRENAATAAAELRRQAQSLEKKAAEDAEILEGEAEKVEERVDRLEAINTILNPGA